MIKRRDVVHKLDPLNLGQIIKALLTKTFAILFMHFIG